MRVDDTVGDLLTHPALSGFGRVLLPWDNRHYDTTMPLRTIGALLPYHSNVDPNIVTASLNRMIDDVSAGQTVFYNFYDSAELQTDSARTNTGLFFFRGTPDAPFALIAPGGGFAYVGSIHEGFPYAVEINRRGFNAFVLKYRVGGAGRAATRDLAAALSFIIDNARSLRVAPEHYSLWGSSAGARMVASIGSHGTAVYGGPAISPPAAIVLLYTGHSEHGAAEPPTFVAVGGEDGIAPPALMKQRVAALRKIGAEVEYHQYARVGHGFGLGTGTSAEGWIEDAIRFWSEHMPHRDRLSAEHAATDALSTEETP